MSSLLPGAKRVIARVLSRDIPKLRERMGISLIDMHWLCGAMTRKWKEDSKEFVKDPSLSILIRYLSKYPKDNPIPVPPSTEEISALLEQFWDEDRDMKFVPRRLGTLFGCTSLQGYKWGTDQEPSQTVKHLMLLLQNAINRDGKEGLDRFLGVVKEEAIARGMTTKQDLWVEGWKIRSTRKDEELS